MTITACPRVGPYHNLTLINVLDISNNYVSITPFSRSVALEQNFVSSQTS